METKQEKHKRRRRILFRNTLFASMGYSIPWTCLLIAKILDLASYTYENINILGLIVVGGQLLFLTTILLKPKMTIRFVNTLYFSQLINWLFIFVYMTSFLNEIRTFSLFCSLIALIFLLSNAELIPSLTLSFLVSASYAAISYYQINYGNQTGLFAIELLYVSIFSLSTVFIAFAADNFSRQRRELVLAKRELEDSMKQIKTAKKIAESANLAKSEFFANMSHELRTPLHGILSFAGFGIKKYASADQEKLLHYFIKIDESGQILLDLLNDLLDLARLESGKMIFEFQQANLITHISKVIDEQSSFMAEKNISVHFSKPQFAATAMIDPVKIKQVLRNLLNNAIKFSPIGSKIRVDLKEGNNYLVVMVRDQGPGIPEKELQSVFEKFIQSSETKSGAGGTGLGLSICRNIISAHEGSIWAENHSEGGALLSFKIPSPIPETMQAQPRTQVIAGI